MLAAPAAGREVRYFIETALGFIYGRHILRFFRQYYKPALGILIGLAALGNILTLVEYMKHRKKEALAH